MLSFTEKRTLQRVVQDKISELEGAGLSFKEKREAQRALEEALAKLEGAVAPRVNSKLNDLLAGKFTNEEPMRFLAILEEVVNELNGDIEPIKEPTIAYIKRAKMLGEEAA
jgi:hypothetical protein